MKTIDAVGVAMVDTPEGMKGYVVLAPPSVAFSKGLVPEAIMGILVDPEKPIVPDNFQTHSIFARFLADVIARNGPDDPELRAQAESAADGHIFVVDRRTPDTEPKVPPEDVIGAFRVGSGKILPGSYVASPTHRLLTARGFFQLSPALWECLQREIAERA